MKKIIFLLWGVIFLFGCATVSPNPTLPEPEQKIEEDQTAPEPQPEQSVPPKPEQPLQDSLELNNIKHEELNQYVHKKGVVFAKVEVQGILKSDFLNFIIEDIEDTSHQFQLFIGDKIGSKSFPWEGETKNEGHFFIELPTGRYRFVSVGIPVGSTMATESLNISFEVPPGQITYLGTLKMIGTKEKVRLGGVPVIKPGFEYTKEVLDEKEEAVDNFHKRYPNFNVDIVEDLMVVQE